MQEQQEKEIAPLAKAFVSACDGILRIDDRTGLRVCASLMSKRFLIATGLAGSGKTKLALAFARWLTPSMRAADPFTIGAQIKSDRIAYEVLAADSLCVEFQNPDGNKVMLPRQMIQEWTDHIRANNLTRKVGARDIREAVKPSSNYSDQLHSFETHLKAAAFALAEAPETPIQSYEVIAVGADWMGSENVLGYPDGLDPRAYVMRPALDLILQASEAPTLPHFLILDEMNLSHVERYFADILSAIESEEEISLHDGTRTSSGRAVPSRIRIPQNLFIIGTVNVDETTYMFSPKVLDRANVIEFRVDEGEMQSFLRNPIRPDLTQLDARGAVYARAFVESAKRTTDVPASMVNDFDAELLLFFNVMQSHGVEFGYRVAFEGARFLYFYDLLNTTSGARTSFDTAFDCVVLQKLLPKLHGSRAKLSPILKSLWFLCAQSAPPYGSDRFADAKNAARTGSDPTVDIPTDARYALSADKIARMWRRLVESGFTSFAEA